MMDDPAAADDMSVFGYPVNELDSPVGNEFGLDMGDIDEDLKKAAAVAQMQGALQVHMCRVPAHRQIVGKDHFHQQ